VAEVGAGVRGEPVEDVSGLLVVPGGVDAHTHMQLPVGAVRVSDDFATGTAAAAVGGTTTVIDYVTAYRGQDPLGALATWQRWAEPAAVDVGLHMTFTEAVPEAVVADCIERGVTSFKLYLAYPQFCRSTTTRRRRAERARHGGLVTSTAKRQPSGAAAPGAGRGRTSVVEHRATVPPPSRPRPSAGGPAGRGGGGARHVVHLSSAPGLAEVRRRAGGAARRDLPPCLHLDAALLEGPAAN
jgi:dihydropyrimidinase